ncbi:MAG: PfaD family polyunsaturated fatty acid/polyketide biosynthesis protein [Verrucomicrobiota bacterium]
MPSAIFDTTRLFRNPARIVFDPEKGCVSATISQDSFPEHCRIIGTLPGLYPEWLGSRAFVQTHNLRFAYVVGEMARGIASVQMVVAAAKSGLMGFYGAGGQSIETIERSICEIEAGLSQGQSWGCNLIHSPHDPRMELELASLLLARRVRRVCASAFMSVEPSIVHYAFSGARRLASGAIERPNHLFVKLSRPEVAAQFLMPAPEALVRNLVEKGALTPEEGKIASVSPVAQYVTVEADSGGHTDNRPLQSLFPIIFRQVQEAAAQFGPEHAIMIGAAGGLGTPAAVAAAYLLGADYVVTGSINQSAVEAGISPRAKVILSQAGLADCTMAPSADMFELGVKVQVLRKGTFFPQRAAKLYELYTNHTSLDKIPLTEIQKLEKEVFRKPIEQIWQECAEFFTRKDPEELRRAESDPRHKMALIFRWYLGSSSHWPIKGEGDRVMDYQIWCGPAMGSFNDWVAGSFLEKPEARTVAQIGLNLLEGACVFVRAGQLRTYGVPVPQQAFSFRPRPLRT